MSAELFRFGTLVVTEHPAEGRRGAVTRISVAGHAEELPEGLSRRLHLVLRDFVRRQNRARGDTPRGRRQLAERAEPQLMDVQGAHRG